MIRLFGFIFLFILSSSTIADELEDVTKLLAQKSAPVGVVFEMVGGDGESLNIALRRTQAYVKKLRKAFPKTKFAIVTHGLEQFSLLEHNQEDNPDLHKRVERIVKDENIPLHVCGAFAEMSDIDTKDFIKTVDGSDSGPLQIQEYVEKGYVLIEMELN